MADFIDLVVNHEGLLPGQTPFRITSPEMANWNTIHGYKTKKGAKPKGRENFLFLENPAEVKPAVKKQFTRYADMPEKYGMSGEITIEQAIRKFDQTGADGKLKYLSGNGIDVKKPLKSFLQEQELAQESMRQMK